MRILLVDDHILFQESLASLIEKQPDMAVVGGAGTVREAVAKTQLLQPDVVLMDFALPDGTGLDATGAILAVQPQTKIVFLTVHEEDDRLFEAIRYGAKGYLLKNIPAAALLAYLRGLDQGESAISPKFVTRIVEEFAQAPPRREPEAELAQRLTPREREVIRELRRGVSNQEIAAHLVISERTVKNHVSSILTKLELHSRHQAAAFARRNGL